MTETPIYVNARDRVSCLQQLVGWLERAGHERITILDNASTYEPLRDYLADTPHTVVHLGSNLGARALWVANLVPDERFVYTDPDVVPTDDCPSDAVAHLHGLLDRFPDFPKAALGFYLDDFPAGLDQGIVTWERSLVCDGVEVAPGVFGTLADTTFALYRPSGTFGYHSLRTGAPYLARHLGWYAEADPSDEDRYYLAHADGGPMASSWAARTTNRGD